MTLEELVVSSTTMTTCPNCAEPPDAAVTVRLAVPDLVSLVAVIVTVPWATPWARPPDEIVATAVLLDAQVTVRPVRMFPFASLSVAVNCADDPAATEAEAGDTVTAAPGAGGPLAVQATVPVTGLPLASLSTALSWAVPPGDTVATAGVTVTDATVPVGPETKFSRPWSTQPSGPVSKSTCQRTWLSPAVSLTGPPTRVPRAPLGWVPTMLPD